MRNHATGASTPSTKSSCSEAPRRPRACIARTIVLYCSPKVTRPCATIRGAPNQRPISFHAAPGRDAAATTAPSGLVHVHSSAAGPMTSTTSKPPAAIDSVARSPTMAPAATSTRL